MKRRAAQPPRGPYTTPLRQLRRRLTFVFTVLTGTVLTVFLAITLGLAQKQTQLSAQSMFDASVDTLIVTLQTSPTRLLPRRRPRMDCSFSSRTTAPRCFSAAAGRPPPRAGPCWSVRRRQGLQRV